MGDRLGPSGLLKASLTEPNQQEMQQDVKCHRMDWEDVYKMGIEAFNLLNFLPLIFSNSFFSPGPVKHLQKLFIIWSNK